MLSRTLTPKRGGPNGAFPPECASVQCAKVQHRSRSTVAHLIEEYSSHSAPPLRYWEASKGPGKFELHTIGRQNRPFRATENNKKNTVPARYFWTTARIRLLKKTVVQKFTDLLARPTFLLLVRCARSSFSLDLLAGYTVLGCYEITMLA